MHIFWTRTLNLDFMFFKERIMVRKSNEKIIVFGAGNTAEKVSKYINKRTNVILCYADNDIKKHGKKLNGKEIIDPKFISSIDYIIIASIYWKEEIKPRTIFGKIICEFQIVKTT